ncbi:unnamed protein product, partial [Closterium sp. Naga37s-1]
HQVAEMFYHAYDGYKRFAFPQDELKPLSCSGSNPYGGMAMTLMESLGTLLLLGNVSEFNWGVEYLSQHLSFDLDIRVNVFEANIRALGSLLSAHMLILQSRDPALPPVHPSLAGVHLAPGYNGRLLELAIDLGFRLLPAFSSGTPIPYAWVNLRRGVLPDDVTHTCTAGAGTLLLEFSALSNLSGIPIFQEKAEAAVVALYRRRSPLNLVGNGISSTSGVWLQRESTAGAGIDSFFEYLLKGYLLLGKSTFRRMFSKVYSGAMRYMAVRGESMVRWLLDVGIDNGHLGRHYASSLQAFWPAMQVLAGQTADARVIHSGLWAVWKRFSFLPELFSVTASAVHPVERGYPLRPEMAESAYFLFKATGNHTYLEIGRDIAAALNTVTRTGCGFASVGDVQTHRLDDHMESFLLSETLKYLYLLFSPHIDIAARFVFSTEGHLLSLNLPRIFRVVCPSEDHPDMSPAGDCRVVAATADMDADVDTDVDADMSQSALQAPNEAQKPPDESQRPQSQPPLLEKQQPSFESRKPSSESRKPSFEARVCEDSLSALGSLVDPDLALRRQLVCEAVVGTFGREEHGGKGWYAISEKGSVEGSREKEAETREEGLKEMEERETRERRERRMGRDERKRRLERARERERRKEVAEKNLDERQRDMQRERELRRLRTQAAGLRLMQGRRDERWRSPLEEEVSRLASFIRFQERQREQQLAAAAVAAAAAAAAAGGEEGAEGAGREGVGEQGQCPAGDLDNIFPDAAAAAAAAGAGAGGTGDAAMGGRRLGGVVSRVIGNQRLLCYFMVDASHGPSCFAWNALPAAFPYLQGFQTLTVPAEPTCVVCLLVWLCPPMLPLCSLPTSLSPHPSPIPLEHKSTCKPRRAPLCEHKVPAAPPCVVRLVNFPPPENEGSSGHQTNVTVREDSDVVTSGEETAARDGVSLGKSNPSSGDVSEKGSEAAAEGTGSDAVTSGEETAACDGVSPGKGNPSPGDISEEGSEAAAEGLAAGDESSSAAEGLARGKGSAAGETPGVGDSDPAVRIPSVSLGNADGALLLAVMRGQMSVREAARRKAEGAEGEREGESEGGSEGESEDGSEGVREVESERESEVNSGIVQDGTEGENESGCEGVGGEEFSGRNKKEECKDQRDQEGSKAHGSGVEDEGGGDGLSRLDDGRGPKVWVKLFCPKKRTEDDQPVLFDVDVSVPPQSPLQMQQAVNALIILLKGGHLNRLLTFA